MCKLENQKPRYWQLWQFWWKRFLQSHQGKKSKSSCARALAPELQQSFPLSWLCLCFWVSGWIRTCANDFMSAAFFLGIAVGSFSEDVLVFFFVFFFWGPWIWRIIKFSLWRTNPFFFFFSLPCGSPARCQDAASWVGDPRGSLGGSLQGFRGAQILL